MGNGGMGWWFIVMKWIIPPFPTFSTRKKNTLLRVIPTMTFQNRHSFWHSIWHSYLAFLSGILIWHSIWHSIWRSIWHSIWHIFWHSLRRLRSGREHLAWILAVEVRQGTLGVDSRGWGPAGNTWRGWSWLRSGGGGRRKAAEVNWHKI